MRIVALVLTIIAAALTLGCQHLVEENSSPSDRSSGGGQSDSHWWDKVDWSGGGSAPK